MECPILRLRELQQVKEGFYQPFVSKGRQGAEVATIEHIMQDVCFDGDKSQRIHNHSLKYVKKRLNPLSGRPSTPQVLALMGYKKPPTSYKNLSVTPDYSSAK